MNSRVLFLSGINLFRSLRVCIGCTWIYRRRRCMRRKKKFFFKADVMISSRWHFYIYVRAANTYVNNATARAREPRNDACTCVFCVRERVHVISVPVFQSEQGLRYLHTVAATTALSPLDLKYVGVHAFVRLEIASRACDWTRTFSKTMQSGGEWIRTTARSDSVECPLNP